MRRAVFLIFIAVFSAFSPVAVFAEPGIGSDAHVRLTVFFYLFLCVFLLPSLFAVYLVYCFIRNRFSSRYWQKMITPSCPIDYDSYRN